MIGSAPFATAYPASSPGRRLTDGAEYTRRASGVLVVRLRQQVGTMEHPFHVCMGDRVARLAVGVHNRARIRLMGSPEERTSSAFWTVLPHQPARTRLSKIVIHFDKPSKRGFDENDLRKATGNEN